MTNFDNIPGIDEISVESRRVFVRVDFNVPLTPEGKVSDDTRIRGVLPTLNHALDENAKIIIMSHLGRPKGQRQEKFSLAPAAKRLSRLLSKNVSLAPDCIGDQVAKLVADAKEGDVIMLENTLERNLRNKALRYYVSQPLMGIVSASLRHHRHHRRHRRHRYHHHRHH